jgi:hypothetical protein
MSEREREKSFLWACGEGQRETNEGRESGVSCRRGLESFKTKYES